MPSSQAQPDSNPDSTAPSAKPFSLSLSGSSTSNGALKKTSFNIQSSTQATGLPNRTLGRRPHQLRHDDDESDEEEERIPAHEEVTGFDTQTGTAITVDGHDASSGKRELVIPVTSKNNWRDRPGVNLRRGKKNLLPREVQALREAERSGKPVEDVETDAPSMSYGLSYAQPAAQPTTEDQPMQDAEQPLLPVPVEERKPLTQDEIALQALIRESKGDAERRPDLVIESTKHPVDGEEGEENSYAMRYDETSSFRADIASRPDSATLDAYNDIPVEEFGAALLRGMGWKEGQPIGRGKYHAGAPSDRANGPRIPERRPGFLGIGAKDLSGGKGAEVEIGAWGKAAMRKSSRKSGKEGATEGVYMPVLMRNKKTGEYITEEELAARQKEAKAKKRHEDEWKERRDRNLEKSGRDRDRNRDRDRRREYENGDEDSTSDRYERRRNGSSRRDRSLSSDSRHSRRRRYDEEDEGGKDDWYYRERDHHRDRERDRDRDRERDRDRDRSHRHRDDGRYSSRHSSSRYGRDRDRDRDRDGDRDRDSHRRRRDDDR